MLGYEVREKGAPHNCLDDACAAMKLVLARIKHGVDKEFPLTLVQEHVSCLVYLMYCCTHGGRYLNVITVPFSHFRFQKVI